MELLALLPEEARQALAKDLERPDGARQALKIMSLLPELPDHTSAGTGGEFDERLKELHDQMRACREVLEKVAALPEDLRKALAAALAEEDG